MKRKICVVLSVMMALALCCAAYAAEIEMGAVYAGSGAKTSGSDLEFNYSGGNQTQVWKVNKVAENGILCSAYVTCWYENGLFTSYDSCQISAIPAHGICCFAGVQNKGKGGMVFTSTAGNSILKSTIAKVKHVSDDVEFRITFGAVVVID